MKAKQASAGREKKRRDTLGESKAYGGLDLASWTKLAKLGSTNAVTGLSQMMNQDLRVTALGLEEVSMRNAIDLRGKADDEVVGIYLLFSGNANGQIMLAFRPSTAFELVDMALGVPLGTTKRLGEMERSVLGEIGNIAGSFFLNAVADSGGFRLAPSPPVVVMDMAGALMGSVMAEVLEEYDSVFIIRLVFGTSTRQIEGRFLVLPAFTAPADTSEPTQAETS